MDLMSLLEHLNTISYVGNLPIVWVFRLSNGTPQQ